MLERFKVVCIPCKALYKCSALLCFAFSFPAKAGRHIPTPEGWKAELAWVAGYIPK